VFSARVTTWSACDDRRRSAVPSLDAPCPDRGRRQNRRGKANAPGAFTDTVAHPRAAHADRTDAGHDLALSQKRASIPRERMNLILLAICWEVHV
jgi:hypothetical protein